MRFHKFSLLSLLLVLVCAEAHAQLITFEGITTAAQAQIPNGYAGFNWQNMFVTAPALDPGSWQGYGYWNGLISGQYVALDGFGNPASVSTINGAQTISGFTGYFTAAWTNDLVLTVQGLVNGSVVQTFQTDLVYTGPEFYAVNFAQKVDTIEFSTYTPTDPNNAEFGLDNLTINPQAVPEPGSLAVLGLGAVCVIRHRRREHDLVEEPKDAHVA
jgi:hypothetical protein